MATPAKSRDIEKHAMIALMAARRLSGHPSAPKTPAGMLGVATHDKGPWNYGDQHHPQNSGKATVRNVG